MNVTVQSTLSIHPIDPARPECQSGDSLTYLNRLWFP